jgi:hypothetical protein
MIIKRDARRDVRGKSDLLPYHSRNETERHFMYTHTHTHARKNLHT